MEAITRIEGGHFETRATRRVQLTIINISFHRSSRNDVITDRDIVAPFLISRPIILKSVELFRILYLILYLIITAVPVRVNIHGKYRSKVPLKNAS